MDTILIEKDVILDKYFSHVKGKTYTVNYLFMGFTKTENNHEMINRAFFIHFQEALVNEKYKIHTQADDFSSFSFKINEVEIVASIKYGTNRENENLWEVSISSDFITLSIFRKLFLPRLKSVFSYRYCFKDEISYEICKQAYPLINELENILREYLLRFFIQKVGSKWWSINSNESLNSKHKKHGSTREFNELLNMEIYNIDFVDLRELVTGNFTKLSSAQVLQTLEGIEQSVNELSTATETSEIGTEKVISKINKLKDNYLGNWEKFFAKHIEIQDFKNIWQKLYEIRCSVSHNSLVSLNNFYDLIKYYDLIKPKMTSIITEMETTNLSSNERAEIDEVNKQLTEILSLNIKFSSMDVEEILTTNSFTIVSRNLQNNPVEHEQYRKELEKVLDSLSIIGLIEKIIIQADDKEIPPSCWVKFKAIEEGTKRILQYGISSKSFA